MSFTGVEIWFFLPVVLVLYWLLPRRATWQNVFLLVASYLFYASWHPHLLVVIVAATAVDFGLGLYIHRQRQAAYPEGDDCDPLPGPQRRMRIALGLSIAYGVGQLLYFKYSGFFAQSFNDLMGIVGLDARLPILRLLLPLGISFWTLQKLSYIIDVYYGRIDACRSPLTFATYVAFFPQLMAGPIPRGGELIPQLDGARRLSAEHLEKGAGQFFLGIIKKLFIADFIGMHLVDPVFADPGAYSTAAHWLALLGYAIQVFMDFSGYSDLAIGCARMFGIELPMNFNYPFFSKTLIEFWRRWHITLNTWLFEYIYGPMVTGRSWLRGRYDLGFLAVFLVSGLWHGAMWTFIVWGFLHAIGLIVQRRWDEHYRGLCRRDRKYVALRKTRGYLLASWAFTQLFFLFTLIPFRAPSLAVAGEFVTNLFAPQSGLLLPPPLVFLRTPLLLGCVVLFFAYHVFEWSKFRPVRDRFFAMSPLARGAIYGLVIAFLMQFVPLGSGTFIYANF